MDTKTPALDTVRSKLIADNCAIGAIGPTPQAKWRSRTGLAVGLTCADRFADIVQRTNPRGFINSGGK
jgi:hypothetical protein